MYLLSTYSRPYAPHSRYLNPSLLCHRGLFILAWPAECEAHPAIPPTALSDPQPQLHKAQASLASHIHKARALGSPLNGQESLKLDPSELRQFIHFNR